jgi:hypothetical protein
MRKRSRIAFACLAVACLGGIVWPVLQPHEPVYEGKPLSYWLELTAVTNRMPGGVMQIVGYKTRGRAEEAVRHIGTNAFPALLQLLRVKDSAFKVKLMELAQRQHFIKVNYVPANVRVTMGGLGFHYLGSKAEDAVPAMIAMYDEPGLSEGSKFCLLGSLAEIHVRPELVLPVLAKSMHDPSQLVRAQAATMLVTFSQDAKLAVPILIKMAQDQNAEVRAVGSNTLRLIDPVAAARTGMK